MGEGLKSMGTSAPSYYPLNPWAACPILILTSRFLALLSVTLLMLSHEQEARVLQIQSQPHYSMVCLSIPTCL